MADRNIETLREFAECIELYAHRHRLLLRLELGDCESALSLCRKAIEHCTGLMERGAALPGLEIHRRNLGNLRALEARLLQLIAAEGSTRSLTPAI